MYIKGKKINIFVFILIIILLIIGILTLSLGGYMLVRRIGNLKNNSLSTKLEAYNIKNDFWKFGEKFDDEFNNILFCGIDNFNNTDVIMVISINKKLHKINVLRIPRDTYIGENYKTGKINAVYSSPKPSLSGADTLTYELNNIFRIKIDKYIFMTLDVFEEMIDDIGGVDITLKDDLKIDENNIMKAGKIHLDGKQGANFVRHRKSYLTGDIGRIHAQEQFVKALGKKLVEDKYMSNIPFLNKFYNIVETNIGRKEVNQYTEALKDIDVDTIKTFVLSGQPIMHNKYSVYLLDVDKTVDILNKHFMPEGLTLRASDLKLVKSLESDEDKLKFKSKDQDRLESSTYQEINYGKNEKSYNYNIEDELYDEDEEENNNYDDEDNNDYDEEENNNYDDEIYNAGNQYEENFNYEEGF